MKAVHALPDPPDLTPQPGPETTPGQSVRATLAKLQDSLAEAGLGGQVRVGVSAPPSLPAEPRRARAPALPSRKDSGLPEPTHPVHPNRTEEAAFSLDGLLRPLERPAQGCLIEIAGAPSSGRTALAYRLAAGATARGALVGWVDLPDALDPRFLRRAGADLDSLLWARPPHARAALRAAELLLKTGFATVILDLDPGPGARPGGEDRRRLQSLQRLGAAAWTRLLRAARGSRATVVVLGPARITGSFATLGFDTERCRSLFEDGLLEGLEGRARVVRNRSGPTDHSSAFQAFHRP